MKDLAELSLQRQLRDWQDHWTAESRIRVDKKAKVLAFDIVQWVAKLNLIIGTGQIGPRRYGPSPPSGLNPGPAELLAEARRDLLGLLASGHQAGAVPLHHTLRRGPDARVSHL